MKAICVVSTVETDPFWGIVTFDENETGPIQAIMEDFRARVSVAPGDSYEEWQERLLGKYEFFYIPYVVGQKLKSLEYPSTDRALEIGLKHADEIASMTMSDLMVRVCRLFAI